ncbi:hypothetical protein FB45DRAFT_917703 [Roridomyces roridus]|uniref:Uncharacterized protein n=1 Tax=Roridomyces roridus TaxID=1738132 RepID=A0AAD7BV63_9AGAR|nr:hypothetical protein FB45DRAFT_917703 [Roridomyces roridus]
MTTISHIENLLVQRETASSLSHSENTAILPTFGNASPIPTPVGYHALNTLRTIAFAADDSLWQLFGAIIFKWTADSDNFETVRDNEEAFVTQQRNALPPQEREHILLDIRKQVATAPVVFVLPEEVANFAEFSGEEEQDCKMATGAHLRTEEGVSTLYLLPFLLAAQRFTDEHRSEIEPASYEEELSALVVLVAKTIVHETRHLVGALFESKTPRLVHGSFPVPADDKAAHYWERTRYGSIIAASFVALHSEQLKDARLMLLGALPGGNSVRRVDAATVGSVARTIRRGGLFDNLRFFSASYSYPVAKTDRYWESVDGDAQIFSIPEGVYEPKPVLLSSLTPDQYWRVCATNYRGVIHGRSSKEKQPKSG